MISWIKKLVIRYLSNLELNCCLNSIRTTQLPIYWIVLCGKFFQSFEVDELSYHSAENKVDIAVQKLN